MRRHRDTIRRPGVRAFAVAATLALVAAQSRAQAPLDVDRDGKVEIYTDLVYIARYLLGLPPVPASFRASGTPIPSDDEIRANIAAAAGTLPPTSTAVSTATRTATATQTATPVATDTVAAATAVATGTRTSGPTLTPSRSNSPTRSPTPSPTYAVPEGAEVVKAAAEVSVQNPETFEVIGIGCASAGGCPSSTAHGAFRLGARPRTALRAGALPRGVAQACAGGGTKMETCVDGEQTIVYSNCVEAGSAGHSNERNGTSRLTVGDPNFCTTMLVGSTNAVLLELRGYRHIERDAQGEEVARLEADWVDTLTPTGTGCALAASDTPLVNGLQEVSGSMHFVCDPGALELACPRGSTDLTLSTNSVQITRDSGGFPCELGLRITGTLSVDDRDHNLMGQACRTQFTQTFDNFLLAEAPVGDGTSNVRQDGRMAVDAFGPLDLTTKRQEIGSGTPVPTTQEGSVRFVDGAACPNGGDGEVEVRRPPLVDMTSQTASAPAVLADAGPVREFRQRLYRSTNGPVYQVLQNVDDLGNFGADALQITTLAASEAGAVGQCAFTAGAEVLPQAVAAVKRDEAFPLDHAFKSALIHYATEPQWNRNGGESQGGARNDGAVCIGPDCLSSAVCPSGAACVAFTIRGPGSSPLTQDTASDAGAIPAAHLVQVPPVTSAVGCRLDVTESPFTIAFGGSRPTIEIPQCDPVPSDGFRLPNGSSIVIAYDASFSSLFNASVAGFPIDTDNNQIVCPAGQPPRVLHLGVSELGSVEAPTFRFQQSGVGAPQVVFDFLGGDPAGMQTVTGCVGISRLTTCQ